MGVARKQQGAYDMTDDVNESGTVKGKTRCGPKARSEQSERVPRDIKLRLIQTDNNTNSKSANKLKRYIPIGDRDTSKAPSMGNSRQGKGGLTVRQMKFAEGVAKGEPLIDAYRQAYDNNGGSAKTKHCKASVLAAMPKVQRMVDQLRADIKKAVQLDGPETGRQVVEFLTGMMNDETERGADRIRAAELLGKTHYTALFREQIETTTVQRTDAEVKSELLQRLNKLAAC